MTDIAKRLPRIIAHRGASADAPENTLAALELAADVGARWIEIDVKLSRDGVCVLLHDDFLQRTTNGKGEVAQFDLAELKRLDAGSWFGERFKGEPMPTLEEVIALCLAREIELNLEIKPCPGRNEETALRVVETVRALWPESRPWPLLSSFALPTLEELLVLAPEMPRGLLIRRPTAQALELAERLQCATIHCDAKRVRTDIVRAVAELQLPLLCYTVNDERRAQRLLDMGVDAIFTDRPREMLASIAAPA